MSDLSQVSITEVTTPAKRKDFNGAGTLIGDLRFGERGEVIFPSELADDAEDANDPDEDDTLPVVKIDARLPDEKTEVDAVAVRFVLDSVIDFLEELVLSGEQLRHAGQLMKDVEALRDDLSETPQRGDDDEA